MKYYKYITIITFFLFFSCMNEYEKAVIGQYTVFECSQNVSLDSEEFKSFKLHLFANKKVLFELKDRTINGFWTAGDDGDRTFIEFNLNGINYQGIIDGQNNNVIKILNPNHFISKNIVELSFIKAPALRSVQN